MKFAVHKSCLLHLFDWFHCPRKRNTNFSYKLDFEAVVKQLLGGFNMELFKYRFVDV